jgi:hypothetical protein
MPEVTKPRGRWYFQERENRLSPAASKADASVSPAKPEKLRPLN